MKKVAKIIIDNKNLIFVIFIALIIYSFFGMSKVKIEYSITSYLPKETDTKKALDIMDDEFTTYGSMSLIIRNVTYAEAKELNEKIKNLDGIKSFPFENTKDYYNNSCALFNISFSEDSDSLVTASAYEQIIKILDGYDYLTYSSVVDSYADRLASDVRHVLMLAVIVIVIVLLITSSSFAEVIVFLITFGVSALLNMGTNYLFGTISFISNSVCVILQLALAIDYAIILSNRFAEEKRLNNGDVYEAAINALSKAIPEISGSSLTTIAGLLALTTMSLRLGADLGLVLAKSIICSMMVVFLFMPCLLMSFSKLIEKTTHKNYVKNINFLGKFVYKLRFFIAVLFIVIVAVCTVCSFKLDYVYTSNDIDTSNPSEAMQAKEEIEYNFGYQNQCVVLVPKGDYELEKQVIDKLKEIENISDVTGISGVEITRNKITHTLTEQLNYLDFAVYLGISEELSSSIFGAYAYFIGDSTNDSLENVAIFEANKEIYTASLLEMCDCAFAHNDFIYSYLYDDEDALETYEDLKEQIDDAEKQLIGKNYTRVVFNIDLPTEGEVTFTKVEELNRQIKTICADAIFAGDSISCYDLNDSFSVDNLKVSLLTILFVFIILMFTFKSWGLPIPLTLTIQGAIFINFSYYYIYGNNLFFFVYLIVSAIQMGATIDYAIVFTNRYVELKTTLSKKEACIEALSGAFPTILTSGTIMAVAGFLIGAVVSDPLISSLGTCLGRGVIISILCVMFVLPSYLIIFDKAIMKTHFKKYGKSKGKIEHLKKRILVKKTNFAKIIATNNITEVEVNNHEEN